MTKMLSEILEEPRVLSNIEKANEKTLKELSSCLRDRKIRHVTFAGRGTSDHASIFGQYLMTIAGGVVAGLAVPSCLSLYDASVSYGDSLVIAVSQSGSAADALAVIEEAKRQGAVTLAVTNDPNSRLAKGAAYHLDCSAGEEKSVAATKTFTAELSLLYLLTAYWFEKEDLRKSFPILSEKVAELINRAALNMKELTLRYRYMRDGFVISRGISYPIALETMLKVQETCYIRLKAYSSADFYHGPLAQIDETTPVIIYAPKGHSQKDNLAIADKIIAIGAEPLIVTDDEAVTEKYRLTYLVPDAGNEFSEPIVLAAFAQLFAQSLCQLRGGNPDSPRNLQKITVTK